MYLNTTVKIPDMKGKIITKKKADAAYILFQYDSVYMPDKKYAVPKRVIIGKVSDSDPTLMFPNEKFQKFFPQSLLPEELPFARRGCCLKIGSYVIIKKVIEEYSLSSLLGKWFGEDAGLILDLIAYLIVDEENAGQYYPDYAFTHPLFTESMKIYSDAKVCGLLKSMTQERCLGFLEDWNRKKDHKSRIYISYDSTNKNSEAGDIEIVDFGKPKDDKGLPVFNLSVAMDKTNKVPLFYEEYPGSINDISELSFMVDKVSAYHYKKIGFILDRGYFCKDNLKYIDEHGYSFIIMRRGCRDLVSSLVLQNRGSFESSRDAVISPYHEYGITLKGRLYEGDAKERYFHLYYNPVRQAAEREKLEREIDFCRRFLDKSLNTNTQFTKTCQEYFNLHYDSEGLFTGADEKTEVIERSLKLCGYFCIITSESMTASEALVLYKGRDISEKLFRADKSFIGARSERVQSSQSMSSKLFIEFIALIVRNRIYNLLKEQMLRMVTTHQKYLTVPAAIRELEKIEMVRRTHESGYLLDHAVTRTQKIILNSFGLNEEDVRTSAVEINTSLSSGESLMSKEESENAQKEID